MYLLDALVAKEAGLKMEKGGKAQMNNPKPDLKPISRNQYFMHSWIVKLFAFCALTEHKEGMCSPATPAECSFAICQQEE